VVSFVVFMVLLAGVAGWLDSRLNWPKPATRGRRERL